MAADTNTETDLDTDTTTDTAAGSTTTTATATDDDDDDRAHTGRIEPGDWVLFRRKDARSIPFEDAIIVEGRVVKGAPIEYGVANTPDHYLVCEMDTRRGAHVMPYWMHGDDVNYAKWEIARRESKFKTEYGCVNPKWVLAVWSPEREEWLIRKRPEQVAAEKGER